MGPVAALRDPLDRNPLARESVITVLAVGTLMLWFGLVVRTGLSRAVSDALYALTDPIVPDTGHWGLAVSAMSVNLVLFVTLLAFAVAYVRVRDVTVPLTLPDRSDLPLVALAVVGPAAMVAVTDLVAALTGSSLSAVSGTSVGAGASPVIVGMITVLGLLAILPTYLLVAHVIVQRTLRRVADARTTTVVTVAVVAVFGLFDVVTTRVSVVTVVLPLAIALAIVLPVYAAEYYDDRRLTAFAALPLVIVGLGMLETMFVDIDAVADLPFALGKLFVVALGVYAYERTDSLVPSALALTTFVLTTDALVFLLEAGLRV
jgi:hypothetical protein